MIGILQKKSNADLVLLGSSRCFSHLDPRFFFKLPPKTGNIGMNGHSELTAILLRLKNYLAENKTPKYVILSFDPLINPRDYENNSNFTDKNNYASIACFPSKKKHGIGKLFQIQYL
jgi:hypothetical protein